jgi:hypothetical protein
VPEPVKRVDGCEMLKNVVGGIELVSIHTQGAIFIGYALTTNENGQSEHCNQLNINYYFCINDKVMDQ